MPPARSTLSSPSHASISTPSHHPPPRVPIPRLRTRLALAYFPLHAPLQLALFAVVLFRPLVAAPVATLAWGAAPVAAAQVAFVAGCLPAWGGGRRARGGGGGGTRGKIVPAVLSLLLTLLVAAPPTATVLILFGAPLTTHFAHTFLCATHVALLAALPLFYVLGLDKGAWRAVSGAGLPFDGVWGGSVGAVMGAWAGAVPIPLDWDREWQKWPVTIVTGAYLGYAVGSLAGEYLFRGKRISFD